MIHDEFVAFILSQIPNFILGFMALILSFVYILWFVNGDMLIRTSTVKSARIRMISRAVNWIVFGLIFLAFDWIVSQYSLETFRATARVSLFFLMLSELVFQLVQMNRLAKETECKLISWFQSLLQ